MITTKILKSIIILILGSIVLADDIVRYEPNIHFPHVPDYTENTEGRVENAEYDIHHGSSGNVNYKSTSKRSEPLIIMYTTHHPQSYPVPVSGGGGEYQVQEHIPNDQQQYTNHPVSQKSQTTYFYPQQESTNEEIRSDDSEHFKPSSMTDQGWKPIIGSPEWVPISKPGPVLPPVFWKQQNHNNNQQINYFPKKYFPPPPHKLISGPPVMKYYGPKYNRGPIMHHPMMKMIKKPHHPQQYKFMMNKPKYVPVPLAEQSVMIDIPHPFKLPDNKHEVVHVPYEQLQKYLHNIESSSISSIKTE